MKLLVCTMKRHAPNPHSCGNSGGVEIAERLEAAVKQDGLNVIVERAACMSMCLNGPNIRLMPAGRTWHRMDVQKLDEVLAVLQKDT